MAELAEIRKNKTSGLTRQPSKPLRTNQAHSGEFLPDSNAANSERSSKRPSAKNAKNTHVSRVEIIKQSITHKSLSERQSVFLNTAIPPADTMNSSNTLASNANTDLEGRAEIASNKTVVHNTVTTVDTPINEVAANDTNFKATPVINMMTQSIRGVLLPNENTNLLLSPTVKAEVKIDRLTITSGIPLHLYDLVRKAAEDMCAADRNGLHLRKQRNKHGSRYNLNYMIYDDIKYLGFLSLEPRQSNVRFMRLDFNPSKIGHTACKIVAQTMRCLIGADATEIIRQSNITRVDIAVDLYGIDINDMLYFSSRPIDSSSWGKMFKHGKEVHYRLESQYIGSIKSDLYFKAYDKRAERITKSRGKDVPHKSITRVEAHIKPRITKLDGGKTSLQLNNLELMVNPLNKLSITGIPVPGADDGSFALFVLASQHAGAQTALALIKNPKKRALYRKHLLGQAVSCWTPEEYWKRAIIALRKALVSLA